MEVKAAVFLTVAQNSEISAACRRLKIRSTTVRGEIGAPTSMFPLPTCSRY
jgi:hypothetical protein